MRHGEPRRVVITGIGALTPVGNTAEEFWASLKQGRSGIGPITKFDTTGYPTRIAGEIRNFDEAKYIDKKESRRLDPYLKYAIAPSPYSRRVMMRLSGRPFRGGNVSSITDRHASQ